MRWDVSARLPTTFTNGSCNIGGVILHDSIHVLARSSVRTKGMRRTTPKNIGFRYTPTRHSTSVQTDLGRPEVPTTAGTSPPIPLHTNTHTRKRRKQEDEDGAVKKTIKGTDSIGSTPRADARATSRNTYRKRRLLYIPKGAVTVR